MKYILISATLALFAVALAPAQSSMHTITLIPASNLSSEKWAELKENQVKKIAEYLNETLTPRQFVISSADSVSTQLTALKIDLSDEEQPKRAPLLQIGKVLNVDFVLYEQVMNTEQKQQERFLYKDLEGICEVKIWLIDVKAEKAILSAKTFVGRSGGARLSADHKGSERQIQAAANAVANGLKDFLKQFPIEKTKRTGDSPNLCQ